MTKYIEKIKQLEKDNSLLSGNLIDAIWTADAETMTFEYITSAIERLSGYSSDEYINLPIEKRVTKQAYQQFMTVLDMEIQRFKQGLKSTRSFEVEFVHKSGEPYWGEIRARLFQEPGEKIKIVGVIRDITERKRQEREKNQLIIALGKAISEKEALLKENRMLSGLLPICSGCKRIRDGEGKWWPLDAYVEKKTEATLTHTICKDCSDAFYGDEEWYNKHRRKNQE